MTLNYRASPTPSVQTKAPSKRLSKSDEQLAALRKHWDEETAKRIHVIVRVRPLNVKEIKENSKVRLMSGFT